MPPSPQNSFVVVLLLVAEIDGKSLTLKRHWFKFGSSKFWSTFFLGKSSFKSYDTFFFTWTFPPRDTYPKTKISQKQKNFFGKVSLNLYQKISETKGNSFEQKIPLVAYVPKICQKTKVIPLNKKSPPPRHTYPTLVKNKKIIHLRLRYNVHSELSGKSTGFKMRYFKNFQNFQSRLFFLVYWDFDTYFHSKTFRFEHRTGSIFRKTFQKNMTHGFRLKELWKSKKNFKNDFFKI